MAQLTLEIRADPKVVVYLPHILVVEALMISLFSFIPWKQPFLLVFEVACKFGIVSFALIVRPRLVYFEISQPATSVTFFFYTTRFSRKTLFPFQLWLWSAIDVIALQKAKFLHIFQKAAVFYLEPIQFFNFFQTNKLVSHLNVRDMTESCRHTNLPLLEFLSSLYNLLFLTQSNIDISERVWLWILYKIR